MKFKCKKEGSIKIDISFIIGKKDENNNSTSFYVRKYCYFDNSHIYPNRFLNKFFYIFCFIIAGAIYNALNERHDENIPL